MLLDLSGAESAILNRESSDSESCDSNRAIPRSLTVASIGCGSDGDSERFCEIFYFIAVRLISGFSLRNLCRLQARHSGNRAIRDSRFCGPQSP